MSSNSHNSWLFVAGLIAAPFYLSLIFTLGTFEPEYSQLTTTMSVLGGVSGVRGLTFNVGVAVTGMLVIAFGVGLWQLLPHKRSTKIGFGLLVIGGLGLIGAGYFHCNVGCKNIFVEPDLTGRLHMLASLLSGMGSGLAPLFFWAAMRGSVKWKELATPTLVLAILANLPGITFWITLATDNRLLSVEGLIQRLGFIFVLIWIFYVALKLLRMTVHVGTET